MEKCQNQFDYKERSKNTNDQQEWNEIMKTPS